MTFLILILKLARISFGGGMDAFHLPGLWRLDRTRMIPCPTQLGYCPMLNSKLINLIYLPLTQNSSHANFETSSSWVQFDQIQPVNRPNSNSILSRSNEDNFVGEKRSNECRRLRVKEALYRSTIFLGGLFTQFFTSFKKK